MRDAPTVAAAELYRQAAQLRQDANYAEAERRLLQTLELEHDCAAAHLELGLTYRDQARMLLKRREFAAGWREYAWRVRIPEVDHWRDYDYPMWQGEALSGKRLLVQAEQGLGDQIMFASCLPDVLANAQYTVLECDPRLAKLFARSFPRAAVYRHRVTGEPAWAHEPAPDFRTRYGDLPRMTIREMHKRHVVAEAVQIVEAVDI